MRRAVGPKLLGRAKDASAPATETVRGDQAIDGSVSPVTVPCQVILSSDDRKL